MITRISAEFDAPEIADIAISRIKASVKGVHSANVIYRKSAVRAEKLRGGTLYTVIPTAVTTHTYFTAVLESPASEDVMPEPSRNRRATAYIICEEESIHGVRAYLNAMGGLNISAPEINA